MNQAELVSLHSDEEQQFVAGLNSAEFPWLGGQRDPLNLNNWVWSDGTAWDYTNWLTGQPDNWNNNERCAHMASSHEWNDITCGDQRAFVCKQTNPGAESTPPPTGSINF